MRTLQLFISLLFLTACNEHKAPSMQIEIPLNARVDTIRLLDTLGYVTLSIPNRYDTFFQWRHTSDCYGCGMEKHRYQPSNLRVFKESGWYYSGEPKDSIEQITSFYSEYHPFIHTSDSNSMKRMHPQIKANYTYDYNVTADTVEKINDRYFSIVAIDQFDSSKNQFIKKVMAETSIRANQVRIQYELLTKVNDSICQNFIRNSRILLRSIRFSNGI
jgi:hypothetical protein